VVEDSFDEEALDEPITRLGDLWLLPVILPEFEKPKVLTYSLESTVAEKLDAIIVLRSTQFRLSSG
jgi:hypothetical protein